MEEYHKKSEHLTKEVSEKHNVRKPIVSKRMQKKKKRKIPFIPVFGIIFLIAAVSAAILFFSPSRKPVDRAEYFGLAPDISYGLIVNEERVSGYPIKHAGYWYLDYNTVYNYITSKMYFDGEKLLYTNPTKTYSAVPGTALYKDEDDLSYQLSYEPCFIQDGTLFLALDYLQLMDYDYYLIDTDWMYAWIWNDWTEKTVSELKKDTVLRYGSGIKNPVVESLEKGQRVTVLEDGNKWAVVQSESGRIGCIQKSVMGAAQSMTATVPDGRPIPEYTDRMLDSTVCLAWHQVFTESGEKQLDKLLKHADSLNVLVPTWLTIADNKGNIQSLADENYVKKAHDKGIQVWAMVDDINIDTDASQVLGITANRKHLINEIMTEAERTGVDGINLDLEKVGAENGAHLLQFIREMSAACRKEGLVLSVDNYSPMPHTAFYDRSQQAEMVDYVIVMAYDEHYAGDDDAGSTSSIGWVRQSAERTLREVPKEKLIIGLPFYTRLWKETAGENGEVKLTSEGISMEGCSNIVKEHNLSKQWLEKEQQYYVEYGETNTFYRLWIEDEESMAAKLNAAFAYAPGGVGFFKIGLETEEVWVHVRQYVSGTKE